MDIRPAHSTDINNLLDIDGTIESTHYLHIDQQTGDNGAMSWKIEERLLRETKVIPYPIAEESRFFLGQLLSGVEEGLALAVERDDLPIALLLARPDNEAHTLTVLDLRVESDYRRQGLATGLLFKVIGEARQRDLRAVFLETRTDNTPMYRLLPRCGFELAGLDTRRRSNHDLVKESATLFWYASLD